MAVVRRGGEIPLLPRNCKSYESRSIGHCSS